jgi:hypothetical protein
MRQLPFCFWHKALPRTKIVCFFSAASFEFDSRPGPVRDRIAEVLKQWMQTLTRAVEGAKRPGHVKASVDAEQLAFEIKSLAIGAHSGFQFADDGKAMKRMRSILLERIHSLATPKCPEIKQHSAARLRLRAVHKGR